jgi:vacuolar-type H+-ATPase subunit E/Vma4
MLSPNDAAALITARLAELEREEEVLLAQYAAAKGELRNMLAKLQPPQEAPPDA